MMKKIVLLTVGSRGDVQPYVALGKGLAEAGFGVTVATHEPFREFVTTHGLAFAPVSGNPRDLLNSAEGRGWLDSNQNPIQFIRYFIELAKPQLEQAFRDTMAACEGADMVIYALLGNTGFSAAQALGVPGLMASLQPITPTTAFPTVGDATGLHRLGGWYNYLTHRVAEQVLWQPFRGLVNKWRTEDLGLPPIGFWGPFRDVEKRPILYGYSPAVLPKPPAWDVNIHVTGYWFLDAQANWQPPAALRDFLAAGEKPVYIGFGSMTDREPQKLLQTVLDAVEQAGVRAILLRGWADLETAALPDTIFPVSDVPHSWLFPRMAAVVHHGGAGTTAAGLRAGVPSLLVPFFADQHFWARRVSGLGVGPASVTRRRLTTEKLASGLRTAVSDATIQQRAAQLGEQIRQKNGVKTAVGLIQKAFQT